jgi:cyclomaltodextrinase / maltogenic alpha-amylase / neopullulanase
LLSQTHKTTMSTLDWVRDSICYQIFIDRFARSAPLENKYLVESLFFEDWDSPPTAQGYKGGNLWGIIERLPYLQLLGISSIYLTPIFSAACNHRYHTHDYFQVDPLIGGNEAFQMLLDASHRLDIRIIIDGVFNHVGRGFFFFNDIIENGSYSPWTNWFKINGWPISPYDDEKPANYECWHNIRALPQLNHENQAVREYLLRVIEYWTIRGVDGWRFDSPTSILAFNFWQEVRERVKKLNDSCYLVGEVVDEVTEWLDGTTFDGVTNFRFGVPTMLFSCQNNLVDKYLHQRNGKPFRKLTSAKYATKIDELFTCFSWETCTIQFNLLSNHDTPRPLTVAGGDRASVELANLLLFTFPGVPCIYYGDEIGLSGGFDPDCRRSFPNEELWDPETLTYHRQLIMLRHRFSALRRGTFKVLGTKGHLFVFLRSFDGENLIVAANTGIRSQKTVIEYVPATFDTQHHPPRNLLYGSGKVTWSRLESRWNLELSVPGRTGLVLG